MLKLFEHHDVRVKRAHVLNEVTKYLVENEISFMVSPRETRSENLQADFASSSDHR